MVIYCLDRGTQRWRNEKAAVLGTHSRVLNEHLPPSAGRLSRLGIRFFCSLLLPLTQAAIP